MDRTWISLLPVPPPRDGEASRQRVCEPRAQISWPWHLTMGHAGPCAGPRVAAGQLSPSLEQEQEPRRQLSVSRHAWMSGADMPEPCPGAGPSTTNLCPVLQQPTWRSHPGLLQSKQPTFFLSFLPPHFFNFPVNCWEVFFKRDQAHADYF